MTAQVAADLRAAAEVLKRDGWTQGTYTDGTRCCAIGAIRLAANGDPDWPSWRSGNASLALNEVVGEPIHDWNDAPGRTADEVIAALEAAANAAEAGQ